MADIKLIQDILKKYNQEHILHELTKFSNENKENIINQILNIDFEKIIKIYQDTKNNFEYQKGKIEPIEYFDKEQIENKEEFINIGKQIIEEEAYAIVTMAGGQGTRLGFNGPKGTYKLEIGDNGKYIFEILAEKLQISKKMYNVLPYWYIMTSNQNHEQTISFFEEHNYFGYEKNKIKFFTQGELPMVTKDNKLVIEDNKIKMGSNGNGGVYEAMKQQHIIDDMKMKNIKWVYICGVDNILVNPIDPLFIGLTISQNKQIASKSVAKAYPEERVGAFCRRDGKPSMIEYIELSDEMKNMHNEKGELVYGESNIVSHLFSMEAIEFLSNKDLKYHAAYKNDLYKFETFIFDGFEYLDDMLVMRVKREEEFAPIKNKQGEDSPETAERLYTNFLYDINMKN